MIRPDIPAGDPHTRRVVPSMKFLGGFNLALAVLALIRLWRTFGAKRARPPESRGEQDVEAFIVSGIAHVTQFSYNLPHIRGRAKGAPLGCAQRNHASYFRHGWAWCGAKLCGCGAMVSWQGGPAAPQTLGARQRQSTKQCSCITLKVIQYRAISACLLFYRQGRAARTCVSCGRRSRQGPRGRE